MEREKEKYYVITLYGKHPLMKAKGQLNAEQYIIQQSPLYYFLSLTLLKPTKALSHQLLIDPKPTSGKTSVIPDHRISLQVFFMQHPVERALRNTEDA